MVCAHSLGQIFIPISSEDEVPPVHICITEPYAHTVTPRGKGWKAVPTPGVVKRSECDCKARA